MKAAVEAIRAQLPRGWQPLAGPVKINVRVQVPGLSSDVSNRLKSLEDACTEAGVWLDDRQVSSILALKEFGPRGGCETVIGVSEAFDGELRARLLAATVRREAEARRTAQTKTRPRKAKGVTVTPNVRRGT